MLNSFIWMLNNAVYKFEVSSIFIFGFAIFIMVYIFQIWRSTTHLQLTVIEYSLFVMNICKIEKSEIMGALIWEQ